ncbi:DUF4279 domain-containing protein [Methylobacterium sp. JK268]
MAAIAKTHVSLRMAGDDLDPDDVTRPLDVRPTRCGRRGEISQGRSGRPIVARTGIWILQADESYTGALDTRVVALLGRATGDLSIWTSLSQRFRCDVFCGHFMRDFNEGTELTRRPWAC